MKSGREALRHALLSPGSIALIGASDDSAKTTGRPLHYLRQNGFEGAIYPINPRREQVQGERAWRSLEDLPAVPDHAFVLTSTDGAIDAVAACARAGVKVATVLASGFSEAGATGVGRENALRDILSRSPLRLLGPSSLGVVNLHANVMLTANAAFAERDLPRGGVLVASHSGSLIGALASRGKACGVGFAGLISVGNEIDLTIGEICAATLDDPNVSSYLLFLESLRGAGDLRAFALAAHDRGKPIVAYKLGRSSQAAELSASHTGALAGEDDIAEAFLRDCGIARVNTFEAAIEALALVRKTPIRAARSRAPRVGVITTTGGGAAMVVDQLGIRGVVVEAPAASTQARLRDNGVGYRDGRIVDLTMAGVNYAVMKGAIDAMCHSGDYDLVVAVVGSSARFRPELAVSPLVDSANTPTPIAVFLAPHAPQAMRELAAAGVAAFRTPESCADSIAAALARKPPKPGVTCAGSAGRRRSLNELQAYAVLAKVGLPCAPAYALAPQANLADIRRADFHYPVALKVLSADIAHKSDAGGVVLNVAGPEALQAAARRIVRSLSAQGHSVDELLVQPMAQNSGTVLGEALVGFRRDPQVGPIVMVASGGVLTELYRDRAVRLAPVNLEEAREMIDEVRAFRALSGFRNRPHGDLEALARAIVCVSSLMHVQDELVIEAEVNPLLVRDNGVVAVDALVILEKAAHET